jgi:AcrR family transcriptional regulator
MYEHKKRRRGEALEAAILEAAWDELTETGYNRLTMESVASRARTNKAVVYRRWANKAKLVSAALRKHLPKPLLGVPDTGSLREDVLVLLRGIAAMLKTVGAETMRGLMSEQLVSELAPQSRTLNHIGEDKLSTIMIAILKNAERRGEVNFKKMSPRVVTLPFDLLRYEILTTQEPTSEETIIEIVDTIFMPLVRVLKHEKRHTPDK